METKAEPHQNLSRAGESQWTDLIFMTNQPKFSGYFQAFLAALMTFTCGMSAFIRQWFIDKRESILGVAIACIGFGGAAGTWLFSVLLLPTLAEQQGDWTVPLLLAIGMMVVAIIMGLLAMQLAPMRKLHGEDANA